MKYQDLSPEIKALLKEVVRDLNTAQEHIAQHNYGLANNWIEGAKNHLPQDNGEYITWNVLDVRTDLGDLGIE